MRKVRTLCFLACAVLALVPAAALAEAPGCESGHSPGSLVASCDATCVEPLVDAHYECGNCGIWLLPDGKTITTEEECTHQTDPDHHAHGLKKESTDIEACGVNGDIWKCEDCGALYLDAEGGREAPAHVFEEDAYHAEKAGNCTHASTPACYECSRCGERFADPNAPESLLNEEVQGEKDSENHSVPLVSVPERPASEETPGMRAYWMCRACGSIYVDEAGQQKQSFADLVIPTSGGDAPAAMRIVDVRHDRDASEVKVTVILSSLQGDAQIKAQLIGSDNIPLTQSGTQSQTIENPNGDPREVVFRFPAQDILGREVHAAVLAECEDVPIVNVTENPAPSVRLPQMPLEPTLRTQAVLAPENENREVLVKVRAENLISGKRYLLRCTAGDSVQDLRFLAQAAESEKAFCFEIPAAWRGRECSIGSKLYQGDELLYESEAAPVSVPSAEQIQMEDGYLEAEEQKEGACRIMLRVRMSGIDHSEDEVKAVLTDERTGQILDMPQAASKETLREPDGTLRIVFCDVPAASLRAVPIGAKVIIDQGSLHFEQSPPGMEPLVVSQETPTVRVESIQQQNGCAVISIEAHGLEEGREYTASAALLDANTGKALENVPQATQEFVPEEDLCKVCIVMSEPAPRDMDIAARVMVHSGQDVVADTEDNAGASTGEGVPVLHIEPPEEETSREAKSAPGEEARIVPGECVKTEGSKYTVFSESVEYSYSGTGRGMEIAAILIDSESGWPIMSDGVPAAAVTDIGSDPEGNVHLSVTASNESLEGTKPHLKTSLIKKGRVIADTDGGETHVPALLVTGSHMNAPKNDGSQILTVRFSYTGLAPGLDYTFIGTVVSAQTGEKIDDIALVAKPLTAVTSGGQNTLSFNVPRGAISPGGAAIELQLSYADSTLAKVRSGIAGV